jgi:hypothetical protein
VRLQARQNKAESMRWYPEEDLQRKVRVDKQMRPVKKVSADVKRREEGRLDCFQEAVKIRS